MISSSLRLPYRKRKREGNSLLGWFFVVFFYEQSNPAEKVCPATRLWHPLRSPECNKCNFGQMCVHVKFPVGHSPAQTPGVRNQAALRFLVPSSVPLWALTKLPAYPSSPTPICATGALVWTSPPASEQNEAHSGSIHSLKAVPTLLGVNIYLNSLFWQ